MVAQIQLEIPNAGKPKQLNVKSLKKTHVKTIWLSGGMYYPSHPSFQLRINSKNDFKLGPVSVKDKIRINP